LTSLSAVGRLGLGLVVLASCLVLGGAPPVIAQSTSTSTRVSEIEIRGNQKINRESILTVISTRVGDELAPERLERDRLAIENLGWFRLVTQLFQREGNTAKIVFAVTEYPSVTELEVKGSSLFQPDQIRSSFKTKVGQVFNRVDWEADLTSFDKLYTDKGYQVQFRTNLDQAEFLEKGVLRVEVVELKVGSVRLKWPQREIKDKKGNIIRTVDSHKTEDRVVLRELSQRPGVLYNQQQISQDYRALSNLNFFEAINPQVDISRDDLTVTITWELTEKRTGQVSVGAGYSPRQQLIGRGELSDSNFRGRGQAISFAAEIGTFGGDGAPSAEVQFYEPWLTKDHTSMTVALYNKLVYRFSRQLQNIRDNNDRYFERRSGGQLQFGRPFKLPIALGLRFENVQTDELPQGVNFPSQDGTVIAGNIARIYNTRDYVNNPTRGHFLRLTSEIGNASLDRGTPGVDPGFFSKYIVDMRKYWALRKIKATREPEREQETQKTPILAFRFLAGTSTGDLPFFEQFFLGGAETLRGYLEDRFWGKSMFLASVEYRRPLLNRITGVLFADVGDAFNSDTSFRLFGQPFGTDFQQHSGIRLNAAVGVGLRVVTPIGPIRVDLGYGREGARTHFNIGQVF